MYEVFELLLKMHNVSAYKVGKETGIASSTFTAWKNGISNPKPEKLQKIANFFNVSIDYLMGREEMTYELVSTIEKERLSSLINEFPQDSLKAIANICKSERIKRDITEKKAAEEIQIDIDTYLSFENELDNIGIDNIIKVLLYFDIDVSYVTGFLTGLLITALNSDNKVLDKLNVDAGFKKEIRNILNHNM